jgi:hypothetical protein
METPGVASATRSPKGEMPIKFGFPEQSYGKVCNFEQTGQTVEW